MNKIIGIVNFHSSPEVPPLTDNRPLGSTSFLGRYGLCDFALSNLCNSGISTIGLLVKNHQRSILKHIGSMDAWLSNTKIGQEIVMYNEAAHQFPESNTDINNLRENDWVLYEPSIEYIVIVPAHYAMTMDLRPYIHEHIERGEKVTAVYTEEANLKNETICGKIIELDDNGYIASAYQNDGIKHTPKTKVTLGTYILNRKTLVEMIKQLLPKKPYMSLADLIDLGSQLGAFKAHAVKFDGFVRAIDSFPHYMEYSLSLLEKKNFDGIFRPEWPIYTLTHDTPPATYGKDAQVTNSYVSNGAIIEGTVINSIISRNVHIAKGAVVKNCIIFSSAKIGENAKVENALIDKYAIITMGHGVSGTKKSPVYVHQGAML